MIRLYSGTDLEDVIIIWREAFTLAHPFINPQFIDQVEHDIRAIYMSKAITWVYTTEGKIKGFISMLGNEIGALFINPKSHRKGIGTKLINHVAEQHKHLEVEVFKMNSMGNTFYQKYGFVFLKDYMHDPTSQVVLRLKYAG